MSIKKNAQNYFLDKIFPSLVILALGSIGGVIGFYFTLQSTATVVRAIPDTYVRKDVLAETLSPMREDVRETKNDIKEIKEKLGVALGSIK